LLVTAAAAAAAGHGSAQYLDFVDVLTRMHQLLLRAGAGDVRLRSGRLRDVVDRHGLRLRHRLDRDLVAGRQKVVEARNQVAVAIEELRDASDDAWRIDAGGRRGSLARSEEPRAEREREPLSGATPLSRSLSSSSASAASSCSFVLFARGENRTLLLPLALALPTYAFVLKSFMISRNWLYT